MSANVRSSARKSGKRRRGVGVEDHAEGHVGEVVPLGHDLGAEQDPRGGALERRQHGRDLAARGGGVGVEAEDREVALAQRRVELAVQALGPSAVAGHAGRAAARAARGRGLAMAAVVAGNLARRAVQDERHVALRALPHAPAAAAAEEVGPAAAVQQHDRLLTVAPHGVQRLGGVGVQRVGGIAHVEHPHRRQRAAVDARGQHEALEPVHALGPRRGRPGDEHRAGLARATGGDRARVVARVALVLVGGVLLLVDHEQTEVADGREHRRARAHADARLAARSRRHSS